MPPETPSLPQVIEAVSLARESALRAEHALQASQRAAVDAREARDAAARVHALEVRLTSLESRVKPSGVWELAQQVVSRLPPSHLALVVVAVAIAVVLIASSAPSLFIAWLTNGVPTP